MRFYSTFGLQEAYKMLLIARRHRGLGNREREHSSLNLAHDFLNYHRQWES